MLVVVSGSAVDCIPGNGDLTILVLFENESEEKAFERRLQDLEMSIQAKVVGKGKEMHPFSMPFLVFLI